jgi:hypothetical protein
MKLRTRLYCLKEDWKAKRRGERRIAPFGTTRGRIYVKDAETQAPEANDGVKRAFAEATATLNMKITRVDGSIEEIEVPAEIEEL